MFEVLILKPTKQCNADCGFCSSPAMQQEGLKWTINDYKKIIDTLKYSLSDSVVIIWHGGEPMLQGVDFYNQAYEYTRSILPNAKFGIQTNLLLYSNKWKNTFKDVFDGSISTSYEADETERTVNGNSHNYNKVFKNKLHHLIDDGLHALLVGNYTDDSIKKSHDVYDWAKNFNGAVDIRVNHRRPSGRLKGENSLLNPDHYGVILTELFDRWCQDNVNFKILPLNQMIEKIMGDKNGLCPWTKDCGGRFLAIEPNGDIYNCASMADLQDTSLRFGNIFSMMASDSFTTGMHIKIEEPTRFIQQISNSLAMRAIKRRKVHFPKECMSCQHFKECQGGCMKQSLEYNDDLYGKYPYCESWKIIFGHIKQSILSGKCDDLFKRLNKDADFAKLQLKAR